MTEGQPLAVRVVDVQDEANHHAFLRTVFTVFKGPDYRPEYRESRRALPTEESVRYTAAYDGQALVGTYRTWDWGLTLPGADRPTVPVHAISAVTVLPTHRRRGALHAMITEDLAHAAAAGVPAATLLASEPGIYGRYGFGPATETVTWTVEVRRAELTPSARRVAAGGTVEIVDPATLRDVAPLVYEASRRPGAPDRPVFGWDVALGLVELPPRPSEPSGCVLHRDAEGVPTGYLRYGWAESWEHRTPTTRVTVQELRATTAQAYAALWGYLVDLDLVATVVAEDRPVDEALRWMLTDARAARCDDRFDFLWARLLDVPVALSARRYERAGEVTFAVRDPLRHAAGTYRLVADAGIGLCTRHDGPAEVTLDVDLLSAAWLGGADLDAAAVSGRLDGAPAAVARLAALLRTRAAPWTDLWF